ncbi:MAG: transposase [Planctomycetes bacterium]|nr:transposase [Planctomycetota bacterium]
MRYSAPVAYFLTWTCYGTRLHGDERGTVDLEHNQYNTPALEPVARRVKARELQLKDKPFLLDAVGRGAVDRAIRDTCETRSWKLFALNVRTNHVHVVVRAGDIPEKVMTDLKAWATRYLRQAVAAAAGQKIWTRHGSTRWIWKAKWLPVAIRYVVKGQGGDLPMEWFERDEGDDV